jgi:hypothetical protein
MTISIITDPATGKKCYQIIHEKYGEYLNPLTDEQLNMSQEELLSDIQIIANNWIAENDNKAEQ